MFSNLLLTALLAITPVNDDSTGENHLDSLKIKNDIMLSGKRNGIRISDKNNISQKIGKKNSGIRI